MTRSVFVRVWRRYWPLNLLACVVLVVVILFASFLQHAQNRQREGACAVLDRIPMRVDSGVDKARSLYNCGAPKPPIFFFGHPFPRPPKVKPNHPTHTGTSTIVIVQGHTSPARQAPASKPQASGSAKPAPTTPSPSPKPSPKPSPSICIPGVVCLPSLPQN